jgi:carbon starvation protein CstA
MVAEGIIALIWAAAASAFFYQGGDKFNEAFVGNSTTVYNMSIALLGSVGGALAMLGVIACPITSGDTAFRSARLTLADWFKFNQKDWRKRLALTVPILGAGYLISTMDYQIVWRYFSWSNQTLAMLALWAGATYLCKFKNKNSGWIAAIPATYMTSVSVAYILQASEGFKLPSTPSNVVGICCAVICFVIYFVRVYKKSDGTLVDVPLEVSRD